MHNADIKQTRHAHLAELMRRAAVGDGADFLEAMNGAAMLIALFAVQTPQDVRAQIAGDLRQLADWLELVNPARPEYN